MEFNIEEKEEEKGKIKKYEQRVSLYRQITKEIIDNQKRATHIPKSKTMTIQITKKSKEIFDAWSEILLAILSDSKSKSKILSKEILLYNTYSSGSNEIKQNLLLKINSNYYHILDLLNLILKAVKSVDCDFNMLENLRAMINDDLLFCVIICIQHCTNEIMQFYEKLYKGDLINKEISMKIETGFEWLKTCNEFLCCLIKYKLNVLLKEIHLNLLENSIKNVFSFAKKILLNNKRIILNNETQNTNRKLLAFFIYHIFQTNTLFGIFGEFNQADSQPKYQQIFDRFKQFFGFILKSPYFEILFTELYEFETEWDRCKKHKYAISNIGLKFSCLFLPLKNITDSNIKITLKYLLIENNYKIMKVIAERLVFKYDDELLSILNSVIHQNKSKLPILFTNLEENKHEGLILINENIMFLRALIINLCYFTENLNPMQRQLLFENIKDIFYDTLNFIMKYKLFSEGINEKIKIYKPKDFLGLLLNVILKFNKILTKNQKKLEFYNEIKHNLCIFSTELLSKSLNFNEQIYKLYLLQLIDNFENEIIKDKHMKYREEMSRIINDNLNNENMKESGKEIIPKIALKIYVNAAKFDITNALFENISQMHENCANLIKLEQQIYMFLCSISDKVIDKDNFHKQFNLEQNLKMLPLEICNDSIKEFVFKNGIKQIFELYKNILISYENTITQYNLYSNQHNMLNSRISSATTEINAYVNTEFIKKLESDLVTIQKITTLLEKFIICIFELQNVNEHFISYTEIYEDFYNVIIKNDISILLFMKIIKKITENICIFQVADDLIKKFVNFVLNIMRKFNENIIIRIENERIFITHCINSFEFLIQNYKEDVFFTF